MYSGITEEIRLAMLVDRWRRLYASIDSVTEEGNLETISSTMLGTEGSAYLVANRGLFCEAANESSFNSEGTTSNTSEARYYNKSGGGVYDRTEEADVYEVHKL